METDEQQSSWEDAILRGGYRPDAMPVPDGIVPIGGDMGAEDSDFEVSEIPAYMPCGSGEHLYLWVEKQGIATQDVTKRIERAFGVREIDVGCAGKKDVHAITRQWISVQTADDGSDATQRIDDPRIRVLQIARHTNKLRTGHLLGNRFVVNLYGVTATDDVIAADCAKFSCDGFLNYFGAQRFGFDGGNVGHGIRVLLGGRANHQMKKLYVSALQSAMFNYHAAARYRECGFAVLPGDVMQKLRGGCFVCEDADTDSARARNGEIVVTLPLPGKKVMQAKGKCLEREQAVEARFEQFWRDARGCDVHIDQLARFADGTRRPLWVCPDGISFERFAPDAVRIAFSLPAGSYATVFLRQLCGASFTR